MQLRVKVFILIPRNVSGTTNVLFKSVSMILQVQIKADCVMLLELGKGVKITAKAGPTLPP